MADNINPIGFRFHAHLFVRAADRREAQPSDDFRQWIVALMDRAAPVKPAEKPSNSLCRSSAEWGTNVCRGTVFTAQAEDATTAPDWLLEFLAASPLWTRFKVPTCVVGDSERGSSGEASAAVVAMRQFASDEALADALRAAPLTPATPGGDVPLIVVFDARRATRHAVSPSVPSNVSEAAWRWVRPPQSGVAGEQVTTSSSSLSLFIPFAMVHPLLARHDLGGPDVRVASLGATPLSGLLEEVCFKVGYAPKYGS